MPEKNAEVAVYAQQVQDLLDALEEPRAQLAAAKKVVDAWKIDPRKEDTVPTGERDKVYAAEALLRADSDVQKRVDRLTSELRTAQGRLGAARDATTAASHQVVMLNGQPHIWNDTAGEFQPVAGTERAPARTQAQVDAAEAAANKAHEAAAGASAASAEAARARAATEDATRQGEIDKTTAEVARLGAVTAQEQATTARTKALTPFEVAEAEAKAAQEAYKAARETYISKVLDPIAQGGDPDKAASMLVQYDAVHQTRAEALQAEQNTRLAEQLVETKRANQAREAAEAATLEETAKAHRATEATQASAEQRGIASLVSELGGQAVLGAESQVYGTPSAARSDAVAARIQQNYPTQPGQEGESIGMRVLRSMGFVPSPTTGLLGGGRPTVGPPGAPAAVPGAPAPGAAPLPTAQPVPAAYAALPQRAVDLVGAGQPGYAQNEQYLPNGQAAGLVGQAYAIQ